MVILELKLRRYSWSTHKKKTIVKDSPLMGKNLILTKLALLQTLAQRCTRFTQKDSNERILVLSILKIVMNIIGWFAWTMSYLLEMFQDRNISKQKTKNTGGK